MIHRLVVAAIAGAPVLAANPAVAQPAAENIVVTASRLAGPSTAITLPPADLAASDSLADALTRLPDVYVQQPGGRSGFGALFLRGADPNFTTVFLEGIPLNNATSSRGGAVNLSEIGSASIARVELAAGPLSSVHGSGALAGAINLIVADGTDSHAFSASAGAGSRGDATGVLGWRGPLGTAAGASITAEYDNDGEASPGAAFEAIAVTAKLAARGSTRPDRLILRFSDTRARVFPDNSGGAEFAADRGTERRTAREGLIGGNYRLLARPGLFIDASGSWLARRETSISPGVAPSGFDLFGIPAGSDTSRYQRGLAQLVIGAGGAATRIVAGIETQQELGRSRGALDFGGFALPTSFRISRTTLSGFVEASHTRNGLTLTGSARADAIDGLKTRITGRAAARYQLGDALALNASGGTSFKAPSFYALGNPLVGNPALRPEAGRSLDASIAWAPTPRQSLSLTVFHNRFTDLIDFVADPAPRLVNRSVVTSTGMTLAIVQPLGASLDLAARAQYVRTRDADSETPLLNRPAWRAAASLAWRPAATLTITGRYDFTDGRDDVSVPTGPRRLADYSLFGLTIAWVPLPGLSLLGVVDNAMDADTADAIGFRVPDAGREC